MTTPHETWHIVEGARTGLRGRRVHLFYVARWRGKEKKLLRSVCGLIHGQWERRRGHAVACATCRKYATKHHYDPRLFTKEGRPVWHLLHFAPEARALARERETLDDHRALRRGAS